jgi:RNA polymerase sigma factor (sigma-70 family)
MKQPFPSLEEEFVVIERIKKGDKDAAGILYQWFGVVLFQQVILVRLPTVEKAEDVLRDCFRILFEKIDQFTPSNRSIFFWLRRIAINLVIDVYRKEKRTRHIAEKILAEDAMEVVGSFEPTPDVALELQQEKERIRSMIETSFTKINPRYALALRYRLLEEKSREECAKDLGVKINAFDVLFHRACKAFRDNYPP